MVKHLINTDYCPEFNQDTSNVNTVPCNMSAGCPDLAFKSNNVYRYPVCLQGSTPVYDDNGPSSLPWNVIAPSVAVGILIVLLVLILLCLRKRRMRNTTKQTDEVIPLLSKEIPFYKTSVFHNATNFLKGGGKILCLIGQWGSGKSTTAKRVYMSLTGRRPIVIEDILKFDVSSCQEPVIVEEPLPREDLSDIEKNNVVEKVISLCKQIEKTDSTFMIITSTKETWETIADEVNNCVFTETELRNIDLNNLSNLDRMQIFHTIFQSYNPDTPFSEVECIVSRFNINYVGFPEVCTLFSKCDEFQKNGIIFFSRPLRFLSSYLEKMCEISSKREKFLLLVYMSVNEMKIDMNKSNDKLWEIFRSCGFNTNLVDLELVMPEEFVVEEEESVYALQHEIIKRITLITFGKLYFSDLLRFSSRKDLLGWIKHKEKAFLPETLVDGFKQSDIEPYLEINDEQWTEYQERMKITSQT